MAIPLDQQGPSGFAMPDPYGLQDYCQSLLPDAPSTDEIIEALELWKFPQEAYPKDRKKYPKPVCSWIVETPFVGSSHDIHVHLMRQVFVSRPSPCWPRNDVYQLDPAFGKSYFSFFAQLQFEIGHRDRLALRCFTLLCFSLPCWCQLSPLNFALLCVCVVLLVVGVCVAVWCEVCCPVRGFVVFSSAGEWCASRLVSGMAVVELAQLNGC